MDNSNYNRILREIRTLQLPIWKELYQEGFEIGSKVKIGRTKFFELHNVESERSFKEQARDQGLITRHINFGMRTWDLSVDALKKIYDASLRDNFRIDRHVLNTERRMGLPRGMREKAIPETGTYMRDEDWYRIGQAVPIQPCCLDHMIGSPASLTNTVDALRGGVTSIGSIAEIIYRYPSYDNDINQMIETIKALGAMASKKEEGVVVETYLEDGVCASFYDAASFIGWAKLERYIVEDLIGAASCLDFGSTFSNPLLKVATLYALDEINTHKVPMGFVHGDTNCYTTAAANLDRNAPLPICDVMVSHLGLARRPNGAATHAVPLTEAERIPTVEDQIQVLNMAQRIEEESWRFEGIIDWGKIEELSWELVRLGESFFRNVLKGFELEGIDNTNPLEMLIACERLGADAIERMFNVGETGENLPRGFKPCIPTSTYDRFLKAESNILAGVYGDLNKTSKKFYIEKNKRKKVVVCSTDIHVYAYDLICTSFDELGFDVIKLGTSVDPEVVVRNAKESNAEFLAITTWNGMALTYGREVKRLMKEIEGLEESVIVFMGGRLLEDIDGILGKNVAAELNEIGIRTPPTIPDMVKECMEGNL